MHESQAPGMQRLPIEVRQFRRLGRRAEPVLALAEQRMASQRGLDTDLVPLAGDERHFDDRRLVELFDDAVVRLGVPGPDVTRMRLPLPPRVRIPRQLVAPGAPGG
jgi:hypothetical protein